MKYHAKFLTKISSGITLVQKYNRITVLALAFLYIHLKRWEQITSFCDRLRVTNCRVDVKVLFFCLNDSWVNAKWLDKQIAKRKKKSILVKWSGTRTEREMSKTAFNV